MKNVLKIVAFILQANYTQGATATVRRILLPIFWIEGRHVFSAAEPHGRYSRFPRPEQLLFPSK
jgi:hypothetical protein